jgi:hypothetical protein
MPRVLYIYHIWIDTWDRIDFAKYNNQKIGQLIATQKMITSSI